MANKKKVSAKQRAKHIAWAVTYKALQGKKFVPNFYTVRWFYKGQEPDDDNVLSCCKYYKDGACSAMGIDDGRLRCRGVDRIHDLTRAGKVEIVFEEEENSCEGCIFENATPANCCECSRAMSDMYTPKQEGGQQ